LTEREPRSGRAVVSLLGQAQDLLATIALGNTCANGAMLAVALWMALQGAWPSIPTIIGLLVLILIVCEVLPKTMAVRRPEQWALRIAQPMSFVLKISLPVCRLAQKMNLAILKSVTPGSFQPQSTLTDADYQELLEMAYQQGALAQSEKEII